MTVTTIHATILQIREQFRSYFVRTILAITTLYITFGVAGYLSYGGASSPQTLVFYQCNLRCTDFTAGLPRFFHSGPLGEILAPLGTQILTDLGKALGDI